MVILSLQWNGYVSAHPSGSQEMTHLNFPLIPLTRSPHKFHGDAIHHLAAILLRLDAGIGISTISIPLRSISELISTYIFTLKLSLSMDRMGRILDAFLPTNTSK